MLILILSCKGEIAWINWQINYRCGIPCNRAMYCKHIGMLHRTIGGKKSFTLVKTLFSYKWFSLMHQVCFEWCSVIHVMQNWVQVHPAQLQWVDDWLIDWLMDGWIDRSINRPTNQPTDRRTDWMGEWVSEWVGSEKCCLICNAEEFAGVTW